MYCASPTIHVGTRRKETKKVQLPSPCCVSFVIGDSRLAFEEMTLCPRAGGDAKAEQMKKQGSSKLVSWPKETDDPCGKKRDEEGEDPLQLLC